MNAEEAKERLGALKQLNDGTLDVVEASLRILASDMRDGAPKELGMTNRQYADATVPHRRFGPSKRQEIVAELIAQDMSSRQIADVIGVSHETVRRDLNGGTNVPDDDGDDEELTDEGGTFVPPKVEADKEPHVSQNSGENEWYTPAEYIRAVRDVLGEIDLDPASCELANATVQAHQFYTKDNDGLKRKWYGRLFMNPPYGQPLIQQFCDKLVRSLDAGDIAEAIVLVNNATETAWFQPLAERATAMSFHRGRIRFINKEGKPALTPLQGQVFLYFGPSSKRATFESVFSAFGVVK